MMLARPRRAPLLNPYVVFADVAINLLLIMLAYFLVSARLQDAMFAAQARKFWSAAQAKPALVRSCRHIRNGSELYFRFSNHTLFNHTAFPIAQDRLVPEGRQAMLDLGALLASASLAPDVHMVRVTVTYPAAWNFTDHAFKQADAIVGALQQAGVSKRNVIPAGRAQRDPHLGDQSRLAETEVAVELQGPKTHAR